MNRPGTSQESEAIVAAVQRNDLQTVDDLLRDGADPDTRDAATGLTLLMRAAGQGNAPIVQRLLDAGADVFTTDPVAGATALHKACQGGSVDVARLLVEAGAFLDAVTPTMGHTPVMDALWYKWPDLVEYLVGEGADLELGTHYGFSLRQHLAFELEVNARGKEKLVEIDEILRTRQAADAELMNSQIVMSALREGDAAAAEAAIAGGADVNTVSPTVNSFFDGHTPLLVAARDGRTEVVRLLLEAGADTMVVDWTFKGSPLHKATYNGSPDIVRLLVAQPDIDLDVQGPINGYTPLHDALWHGYTECAEILIEAGARVDLYGHDGKLAVDVAALELGEDAPLTRHLRRATAAAGAGSDAR